MEDGTMLNLIFKIHQNGVLDELSLEEAFLVDGAIEEPLVAQVPKEVHRVILREKVLGEISCEVSHLITPEAHCLVRCMVINDGTQSTVEKCHEGVVLLENLTQNAGIFLSEIAVLELSVGDGFSTIFVLLPVFHTVEALRVLQYYVEPDVRFDLA